MARNLKAEAQWAKEKYIIFNVRLPREEFENEIDEIKDEFGLAAFLKKAITLYKEKPELFE